MHSNLTLKTQTVDQKTAKNFRGLLFLPYPVEWLPEDCKQQNDINAQYYKPEATAPALYHLGL